jgi:tRNA threonylcarbamoyladenosine biosynthesis protein TsaB
VDVLILGIETATEQVSVALGNHDGVIGSFELSRGRRHAETLVPAIEFLCRNADVSLAELSCIAVDTGPGLFTGMRVGIATAKGLAHALDIPVVPMCSLDLLAYPLRHTDRVIASVIDARRGELFYAFYRALPGGVQRVTEAQPGKVDDLTAELLARGQLAICVGDGAERYRDEIAAAVAVEFADPWLAHPSAVPMVQLAHRLAVREEWVSAADVEAAYLRLPDATINWNTRASDAARAAGGTP